MVERAQAWGSLAAEHGVTLPGLALAFAALPACVERVVVGCSAAAEVESNLAHLTAAQAVPPSIWSRAQRRGLLPPGIPVPAAE